MACVSLLVFVHRSSRLCGGREQGRSSVGYLGGFGSSTAPRLLSGHFRVRYLWTASVEHADSHPVGTPTARAFYSGGSGLLRDSDLVASVAPYIHIDTDIHITGLVTTSAAISLAGFSSRSGYLNPGGLRWSPRTYSSPISLDSTRYSRAPVKSVHLL